MFWLLVSNWYFMELNFTDCLKKLKNTLVENNISYNLNWLSNDDLCMVIGQNNSTNRKNIELIPYTF